VKNTGRMICRGFRAKDMADLVTPMIEAEPDIVLAKTGDRYRMM